MIRTYAELRRLHTFEERYLYLRLHAGVGEATFGFDRYVNQQFYRSTEWKRVRRDVIARDEGCDLGIPGFEIHNQVLIHHMNPIELDDIRNGDSIILDPNFLITVSHRTHNAIHYGDESQLPRILTPRRAGDTRLW